MRPPHWVSRDALDRMHGALIGLYGGASGVRAGGDELIDSALARPQNKSAYEPGSSLPDLARRTCTGSRRTTGYLDGSKRIGFAAAAAFMGANGARLYADPDEAYEYVIGLVEGRLSEQDVALWISRHSKPAG